LSRVLSRLVGDGRETDLSRLRSFQIVLALVLLTEYWTKALSWWNALEAVDVVALALVTLLCVAAIGGRATRACFAGLALLQLFYVWSYFPQAGNHRYLEIVLAALLATLDREREEEGRLLLHALRWIAVVVLFYSGLQKAVHGLWFEGQFLAYSNWRGGFADALGWLLPAEEALRLSSYDAVPGDGPYLVPGTALSFVSNLVWLSEMLLALLLVPRATRRWAWVAALSLILAVEVVAREFMFGVEFGCMLLLFARTDLVRRIVVPVSIFFVWLVLVRLGFAPPLVFH
jgi:hypothetical protein